MRGRRRENRTGDSIKFWQSHRGETPRASVWLKMRLNLQAGERHKMVPGLDVGSNSL